MSQNEQNLKDLYLFRVCYLVFFVTFSSSVFANPKACGDKTKNTSVLELMKHSVTFNCPELMSQVLKEKNENEILQSIDEFAESSVSHLIPIINELVGKDADDPKAKDTLQKINILSSVGKYLQHRCPEEKKKSVSCAAKKAFSKKSKSLKDAFDQLLAKEEREQEEHSLDSSDILSEICSNKIRISKLKDLIATEKKAGKISGYVNAGNIQQSGIGIINSEKRIEQLMTEYRKETGKDIPKDLKCDNHLE